MHGCRRGAGAASPAWIVAPVATANVGKTHWTSWMVTDTVFVSECERSILASGPLLQQCAMRNLRFVCNQQLLFPLLKRYAVHRVV